MKVFFVHSEADHFHLCVVGEIKMHKFSKLSQPKDNYPPADVLNAITQLLCTPRVRNEVATAFHDLQTILSKVVKTHLNWLLLPVITTRAGQESNDFIAFQFE